MATFTSTACQTNPSGFFLNPPKYIENGMVVRSAVYSFTAAQSAGDVIQMVPIPKGAVVVDTVTTFTPGAGGPVLTWIVGDGGSTNRFQSSASAAVASSVHAQGGGLGYSYSVEDTVDITVAAIASATAAGSVRLSVFYTMDQSTDGNS